MKIYFSLEVMRFLNISSIVYKFRDVREITDCETLLLGSREYLS